MANGRDKRRLTAILAADRYRQCRPPAGEEDIYPGGMAQGVSQGLANDPKVVEKEFVAFG